MSAEYSTGSIRKHDRPSWVAYPLILLIYLYRNTLGVLLQSLFGHMCRFEPSCSHYAEQALRKHGLFRGSKMAALRVLRCHPWHEGGFDPVE
ncbi:MAG: membrane protein insertion efficiency factor YidD [candidate division Zixibacteria bacterium]|nr:membrane protein insertion efficiency factor YidD [candidate division Zixibacteria bacterium]